MTRVAQTVFQVYVGWWSGVQQYHRYSQSQRSAPFGARLPLRFEKTAEFHRCDRQCCFLCDLARSSRTSSATIGWAQEQGESDNRRNDSERVFSWGVWVEKTFEPTVGILRWRRSGSWLVDHGFSLRVQVMLERNERALHHTEVIEGIWQRKCAIAM